MNTTSTEAELAFLVRLVGFAEEQARKTGAAADCFAAARYCGEAAGLAAYVDIGGWLDRAADWRVLGFAAEAAAKVG